jgi:predicted aminopeptidase
MILIYRWTRLLAGYAFFLCCVYFAVRYRMSVYLLQQAKGQVQILTGTEPVAAYMLRPGLPDSVRRNLLLVERVKKFSVDSLGYVPTSGYTRVYDQQNKPVLWVVTAAGAHDLEPYYWKFPLVGRVSYKGFFEKSLAYREYIRLTELGYDAAIRSVSAWSTLGWFNDPLLSNSLYRSKGNLCNLLFHELFHATYYAPGDVNLNENLANFIAHKATIRFLRGDSLSLEIYLGQQQDALLYKNFLMRQYSYLQEGYRTTDPEGLARFKLRAFKMITDSLYQLPVRGGKFPEERKKNILLFRNAYFVDLKQYESLQDSLEAAFNKIYRGDIKKMVRDLTSK